MTITGNSIIAGKRVPGDHGTTRAVNPATGEQLDPEFTFVGKAELDLAVSEAQAAFDVFRATSPEVRASFLERIAELLDANGAEIVDRATQETGLTRPRLTGELGRTTGQLRLFAHELLLGAHQGVRIEQGRPEPPAGSDLRQRQIPIGPIAVFGASNFPLAFSTAGGDTASALAAGCPVIVKAHNSHAGTAELAGQAIAQAVMDAGLPAGVFSMVFGPGSTIGQELASHPGIAGVAFTGSRRAGTALMTTAAARPAPIPVFAEMSSINPVVFMPGALVSDQESLANGLLASLTLGAGQFCTNPGLLFVPRGNDDFLELLARVLRSSAGQTMLSTGICVAYLEGLGRLGEQGAVPVAVGEVGAAGSAPAPALYHTTSDAFRANPDLQEEVFGPAALIVEYTDAEDLRVTLEILQGQLTATIQMTDQDADQAASILPILERKVGRILVNGWPTGVEVNHAVVHGGPFPATSDSRTTSVGSLAIARFQRPVAYQNFPAPLLPVSVRDDNPWGLPRRVNGQLQR